jgi:hypothetical protein
MEMINPDSIKRAKEARALVGKLQDRLMAAESLLEDLSRSVEISRFTGQFNVVDVFVEQASNFLEDRIVVPEVNSNLHIRHVLVEGSLDPEQLGDISSDTIKQVRDSLGKN